MQFRFTTAISLAPGFSQVFHGEDNNSRFNGFCCNLEKPLKRLEVSTNQNHRAEARC